MTAKSRSRSIGITVILCILLAVGIATTSADSLIRIERKSDADRNALIDAGITLVAETDDAFLAVGEPSVIEAAVAARSLAAATLDQNPGAGRFALVGLRPG
jgi:hypothetical protein